MSNKKYHFGIIMPWPGVKNAEYEIIERFKIVAKRYGHTCDTLDKSGNILHESTYNIGSANSSEYDFVISPHYESFKRLDCFHYYTLWNPNTFLQEHHQYEQLITNINSCEALLTTGSANVENFMENLGKDYKQKPAQFPNFYPSSPELNLTGNINKKSVYFYTGINWEAISKKKGRYHDLLKGLDRRKLIKIFGPEKFEGIKPWKGYKTYAGEIPFNGTELIEELSECGVALVIASEVHNKDNLLSNRLWEGLSAGAVIVSNKHPKVEELLGDTALYFDLNDQAEKQLVKHIKWIRQNPEEAKELARRAQEKFKKELSLDVQLNHLLEEHENQVEFFKTNNLALKRDEEVAVVFHTPCLNISKELKSTINSIKKQTYTNFKFYLAVDETLVSRVNRLVKDINCEVVAYKFFEESENVLEPKKFKKRSGEVLVELLERINQSLTVLVRPGMILMKDHLSYLKREFEDDDQIQGVFPAVIKNKDGIPSVENLCDYSFSSGDTNPLITSAMFRTNYLRSQPVSLLNYLDWYEEQFFLKKLQLISKSEGGMLFKTKHIPTLDLTKFKTKWFRPIYSSSEISNSDCQIQSYQFYLKQSFPGFYQEYTYENPPDPIEEIRIRTATSLKRKSGFLYFVGQRFFRFLFR